MLLMNPQIILYTRHALPQCDVKSFILVIFILKVSAILQFNHDKLFLKSHDIQKSSSISQSTFLLASFDSLFITYF